MMGPVASLRERRLEQAIRDAIAALSTPAPRELIAEQLQRALDFHTPEAKP